METWTEKGTERNTNIMPDEKKITQNCQCVADFSYRGWVRVPCRTRATLEIHWERMLLRSWLTFGWLHIWEKKGQDKERGKMVRGAIKMSAVNFTEALSRLLNHSVLWRAKPSLIGRPSGLQLVSEVQAVLLSSRHSATNLDTVNNLKRTFQL